jgi:effector-binding domain-containing protein
MPVAEIKSVLAAPESEARNRLILAHLDRLETDLASTAAAVAELRALITQPAEPGNVEHRTVPPHAAIAIHETVDREDLLDWWQGALGELHAIAVAQGLKPTGAPGGMYAGSILQHGRGPATVFIPTNATPRAIGRVERFTVPATELAIMVHHGSLASADLTYGLLGAHVIRHEISVEGPLREYYLAGLLDTEDLASWETEIGWPIFRSDSRTP